MRWFLLLALLHLSAHAAELVCPHVAASADTLPWSVCRAEGCERRCMPPFQAESQPLPPTLRAQATGVTWRATCPVGLDDLVELTVTRWTTDGAIDTGRIVVAKRWAEPLTGVFRTLYEARFPIARMEPVEAFGGSDERSMAANNTSAFNCRPKTGGGGLSRHSYGDALDLNPLQNPYVRGRFVAPPEGRAWLARTRVRPGMIVPEGVAVRAFAAIGWKWGGRWRAWQDYQHFSSDGT